MCKNWWSAPLSLWNTAPTVYISMCVSVCVWSHIPQNTTQQHNSAWVTLWHFVYMYRITALLIWWCSNLYLFILPFLTLRDPCFPLCLFFFSVHIWLWISCLLSYHAVFWSFSRLSLKNFPLMPQCFMSPIPKCYGSLPLVTVLKWMERGGDWCRVSRERQCYISVYLSTRL